MRLRSGSADSEGRDEVEGHGIRGRITKFFRGNRSPTNTTATDGPLSAPEEEPEEFLTFKDCLELQRFSEASKRLIDQENHLFMHADESVPLQDWNSEVDKLHSDRQKLEAAILTTLRLSLNPEEVSEQALTSAVSAMCNENEQDYVWTQRREAQKPKWRPCNMRNKHDNELKKLVEDRMDNPTAQSSFPVVDQGSSIQNDVWSMGRQIIQDMGTVVEQVRRSYPDSMDICNFYAAQYHRVHGSRLRKIAEFGLDDEDCTFILRWVNEFCPDIFQTPHLCEHIQTQALGKLLPHSLLAPLEEQYLDKQQADMSTHIGKVLNEAKQMWSEGEMPKREDGCFVSDTAFHIIQFVHGAVTSAEKVLADRAKAQSLTNLLQDLLQSYKSFLDEVIKSHRSNRDPTVKANLHCIHQFRNVLDTKRLLFPEDVRGSCLSVLRDMQQAAQNYFLTPVQAELKPQYRKLSSDWLKGSQFKKLLGSIESKSPDLQGLAEISHQELMGQFHLEVTAEFVKRLLRGDKLKDPKKQQEAYISLKRDAESLHETFWKMGSREDWLKDVLLSIGDLLRVQDLAAVQLHVVEMGTTYPDISEKHVSAILKLKSNFPKSHRQTVKETLRDTLNESAAAADNTRLFFSLIPV